MRLTQDRPVGSLLAFYIIHVATAGTLPSGWAWLVFAAPGFFFLLAWGLSRVADHCRASDGAVLRTKHSQRRLHSCADGTPVPLLPKISKNVQTPGSALRLACAGTESRRQLAAPGPEFLAQLLRRCRQAGELFEGFIDRGRFRHIRSKTTVGVQRDPVGSDQ